MKRFGIVTSLIFALLLVLPTVAQDATAVPALDLSNMTEQQFTIQTDPIALVGAYYNAISRGEYQRAYRYWEQPPLGQTEPEFEAGFADTLSAAAIVRLPVLMDAGAGNIFAAIPTLVIANRRNGSQVYFVGCFIAHKTNVPFGDAAEPDPNWYFRDGSLRRQLALNLSALDAACEQTDTFPPDVMPLSQTDPVGVVESYISAIASGNPAGAAAFWEVPPGDLFYAQFNTMFTTASSVNLYVNPIIVSDAGAGNVFATVPALVAATYPNGEGQFAVGCLTAHRTNVPVGDAAEPDPNWYLRDVSMTLVTSERAAVHQLAGGCNPVG